MSDFANTLSAVLKEMTKAMVDLILKEELSEFLGYKLVQ